MKRDLARDDRGAILVIGLVSAVFITGLLYFLFGIGETIRHHERLSDSSDAGAYAVGVMHARGMNLVALANMIKLTVVAVQSAYLAMITGAVATIAWILSSRKRIIKYGWVIPFLVVIITRAASSYSGFSSDARALVRASDDLQEAVREDLPTIALALANEMVAENYSPPAVALVNSPDFSATLKPAPIKQGSSFDLCARAFPFSVGMILNAARDVPSSKPRNRFRAWSIGAAFPYCLSMGVRPYEMESSDLGSEPFQIGVAAIGEPLPALGERGVVLATYMMDDPSSRPIAELRDKLSVLTVAQSEYYFDGPQDPNEMLWRMEWRARLRRYSLRGGRLEAYLRGSVWDVIVR